MWKSATITVDVDPAIAPRPPRPASCDRRGGSAVDGMVVPKPAGGRDVAPIGASSQVSHAQLVGLHTTARTSSVVPRVAVIMLVHADYAQRYLADCYTSLSAQTYSRTQWQLFIVTNGVDAATRSWIKQAAPDAHLIHHEKNLGWSAGNNAAIQTALQQGFDHVVLLNVDTTVEPTWLAELAQKAMSDPNIHIVQPLILLYGTNRINCWENRLHFLGFGYCNDHGSAASTVKLSPSLDFASGAAMLIKREVFERIGLFREDYFLYYDDVEFSWRCRLAGFQIGVARNSLCFHRHDKNRQLHFFSEAQRNRWMTLLTLTHPMTLLLIGPCLVLTDLVLLAYSLLHGIGSAAKHPGDFLKIRTWKLIFQRRREIRKMRKLPDRQIVGSFAATIHLPGNNPFLFQYVVNPLLGAYWMIVRRLLLW